MLNQSPRNEPLMKMVQAVIETLVPGGKIVTAAADTVFAYLDRHQARVALEKALEEAGKRFRGKALERGWGEQAHIILRSLEDDPTVLKEALRSALGQGEVASLQDVLSMHFQNTPGVDPSLAVQAARLYSALILDELWKVEAFREAVRDVLFQDLISDFEKLNQRITRLSRWWTLVPVVQKLPREDLVRNHQIQLVALKAPLGLVAFTGRNHAQLRDNLVAWAQGLNQHRYRTGLKVLYGPGGSGKTRMAVEVARKLEEGGWEAFFLPSLCGDRRRSRRPCASGTRRPCVVYP